MVHYDICQNSHHNEPLSCMGAKASQPTHFLKFRLTEFRLNGVDCISKSKQATTHKLGNLRQKVALYKTGKFLQASVARVVFKFGKKKNQLYRSYMKDFLIKLKALFYLKLKMRKK